MFSLLLSPTLCLSLISWPGPFRDSTTFAQNIRIIRPEVHKAIKEQKKYGGTKIRVR
jgi:hypothetical protein